ncbi:MAG: TRAP transporter substrate-binding protein DctP [Planctomycetota bacterium]
MSEHEAASDPPPRSTTSPLPKRRRSARRAFLAGAGAGAAGLLAACRRDGATRAAAVHTGRRVNWTLASSFPSSLDAMYGPTQVLKRSLEEMSGGAFTLDTFQAGELVGGLEVLDAIQAGAIQVGHTASYYFIGKRRALAFDTCVPFGLTARQHQAWQRYGGGLETVRKLYADFGVIHFPGGNTGAQMGGWFRDPVETPADLEGLRMRIPGMGGQVMDMLGASTQVLAGGEIYTALETARIDATEWVGPYDDERLGFYKKVKNYYYPGWWEPGPELVYQVSRHDWERLPAEYQAMFEAATRVAAADMLQRYDALNPAALDRLVAAGVVLRPFSDALMSAAAEASEDYLSTQAAADPDFAAVLEPWRAFRRASNSWFGTAELEYARSAHRRS